MQHRLALILPIYLLILTASLFFAFSLRFEFNLGTHGLFWFYNSLAFVLGVKLIVFAITREWKRTYRHATTTDLIVTGAACSISAFVLLCAWSLFRNQQFVPPRSIILIDAILSMIFFSTFRIGSQTIWKKWNTKHTRQPSESALIFGTDETAINIWKM
ncbi:MAG: hypothetical protein JKY95_16685, partial [Planctomycetaceae bacterium]|nr:hypothetical protein [Planctomycetaceae bacterium]